jgi:sec-independent protein translocase protein TatB
MLPGLGFSEIIVLAVIALLVIGPKDLPVFLRTLGRWTRKMQGMAAEFRQGFDELARQAELDELRKEVDALRRTATPFSDFSQQAGDIHRDVTAPVDPAEKAPLPAIAQSEAGANPAAPAGESAPAPSPPEAAASAAEARG